ncbi:protein PFC0760c-like, partial [Aphis craccivora]
MTRNKLKKQLTENSELIEATAREHKSSRIDNIKNREKVTSPLVKIENLQAKSIKRNCNLDIY